LISEEKMFATTPKCVTPLDRLRYQVVGLPTGFFKMDHFRDATEEEISEGYGSLDDLVFLRDGSDMIWKGIVCSVPFVMPLFTEYNLYFRYFQLSVIQQNSGYIPVPDRNELRRGEDLNRLHFTGAGVFTRKVRVLDVDSFDVDPKYLAELDVSDSLIKRVLRFFPSLDREADFRGTFDSSVFSLTAGNTYHSFRKLNPDVYICGFVGAEEVPAVLFSLYGNRRVLFTLHQLVMVFEDPEFIVELNKKIYSYLPGFSSSTGFFSRYEVYPVDDTDLLMSDTSEYTAEIYEWIFQWVHNCFSDIFQSRRIMAFNDFMDDFERNDFDLDDLLLLQNRLRSRKYLETYPDIALDGVDAFLTDMILLEKYWSRYGTLFERGSLRSRFESRDDVYTMILDEDEDESEVSETQTDMSIDW
jgi:hypothetical protein